MDVLLGLIEGSVWYHSSGGCSVGHTESYPYTSSAQEQTHH